MDYNYENLGDERFQELCQALLVKEFPNVQCFPVGQPDGGRDALAHWGLRKGSHSFSVFQVKYVRKPQAEKDMHKWLLETLEPELPKLAKLIPKGAQSYYLITNIHGTAHPDAGSIDKCSKLLQDKIPIPSFCWWRDDLNRRLDNAYDLKWVYPEIMGGQDMLRLIVESGLMEHKERRASAIRAFFDDDKDVRFKQIELQNSLLDLFIDVPIGRSRSESERMVQVVFSHQAALYDHAHEDGTPPGAAAVLLGSQFQRAMPKIVLEGAPGQGKSTMAQYICQVHRAHILGEHSTIAILPSNHRPSAIRIPFRVELRDLATWFSKKDPFSSEDSNEAPAGWAKSLDAFLAAQVRHYSGGADFSVDDLHAVARLSAILIVLDGLDEVPDVNKRKEVVAVVTSGVSRLSDLAASLQVVITSRPSAFAASLGFPEDEFPHFQLLSLSKTLISGYADKWLAARRLSIRDAGAVRRILSEKIELPHLRDLARNPMQLAILLSLIHTRGSSLPDKRTALYDQGNRTKTGPLFCQGSCCPMLPY